MDEPAPPRSEPTFAGIEYEFGVHIERSGQLSGTVGFFTCQLPGLPPGTKVWVRGVDAADLRDELIRNKWIADEAAQRGE